MGKKRKVEIRCCELETLMENQGYDKQHIDEKVTAYRAMLLKTNEEELEREKGGMLRDTHQVAEAKRKENDRIKEAFGISKDYVGGSAFDREGRKDQVKAEEKHILISSEDEEEIVEKKKKSKKAKKDKKKKNKKKKSKKSKKKDSSSSDSDSSEEETKKKKKKKKKRTSSSEEESEEKSGIQMKLLKMSGMQQGPIKIEDSSEESSSSSEE